MEKMQKETYLQILGEQIRIKKVRNMVLEEYSQHIDDQKESYLSFGMGEEEAQEKALEQMGDPVSVGMELDRIHRPKSDWRLLSIILLLSLLGIGLQYYFYIQNPLMGEDFWLRQGIFAGVGFLVLGFLYFMDYTFLGKYPYFLGGGCLILLTFALFFGGSVNGFSYFLSVNGRREYLSFFVFLLVPVYGGVLYKERGKGWKGLGFILLLYFLSSGIVYFSTRSLSVWIHFALPCGVMILAAVLKNWYDVDKKRALAGIFVLFGVTAVFIVFYILKNAYLLQRVLATLHPYSDKNGAGYVSVVIRRLLRESQLIGGADIGQSIESILPEARTSYMLANVTASLGYIFTAGILFFIVFLLYRLIRLTLGQKNVLGMMLSLGCTSVFCVETVFYVCANFGLDLGTSLSLPFLSYGGGMFIANMILAGIVLSVFRNTNIVVCADELFCHKSPKAFQ